jgi:hypothetical protein
MATDQIVSVGSAGGRDYSTIAAALAARPANLTTADVRYIIELHDDSEFTSATATWSSNTPSSTCYTVIRAAAGKSFNDRKSTFISNGTRYNTANGVALRFTDVQSYENITLGEGFVFEGLQITRNGAFFGALFLITGGSVPVVFDRCLYDCARNALWTNAGGNRAPIVHRNCIIITEFSPVCIDGSTSNSATFDYCTFISGQYVWKKDYSPGLSARNTAAYALTGNFYDGQVDTGASSKNYSNIASVPGTGSVGSRPDTDLTNVAGYSTYNANVPSTSGLIGNATPISGVTVDIFNQTRSSTSPTVGAIEYVGSNTPPNFSGTISNQTATVGTPFSLDASAYFTDTDALTYSAATLGNGISINTSSGVISGTPSSGGTLTVVVTATDTAAQTANSNSFTITITAGATAVTMSGPSGGLVAVASTNFLVGANGIITGTVTVTPSDSSGGGTFTPTSVNISSGTPTATFTYTPATVGAKTISVTNNGSLANPSNITYTATITNDPPSFTGTIPAQTGTQGTAFTLNTASYFSDTDTLTYSRLGTWPTGVSINSSTGAVTGTPTQTGSFTGLQIRVTDTASQIATSNSFTMTVSAVAVGSIVCQGGMELETNGLPAASLTGLNVRVYNVTTGALTYSITNGTTNSTGVWATISNASIVAGTVYDVVFHESPLATGRMAIRRVTAS